MDLLKVIEERRSTRAFLERPVEREMLEKLLRLATKAPSAINLQPWEFTVVSGEELNRLSRRLLKTDEGEEHIMRARRQKAFARVFC